MSIGLVTAAYVVASILFILALGGLSNQEKAKRAIYYGMIGMALAVGATVFGPGAGNYLLVLLMIVIGGVGGAWIAGKVQMTQMPELVAGFHSLVGLAAVFIGFNADIEAGRAAAALAAGTADQLTGFAATLAKKTPVELSIMRVELFLGIFIGAITFTGSIVAYGKLAGKIDSKALTLPFRHQINLAALILCILLGVLYFNGAGIWTMILVAIIAGAIGWHLIMAIGGADMPVVVSMLNSYSGWAAAAIGFTLSNDLLIVTGALVGSSGAILSYIMCRAMNRNFVSVILGGWGGATGPAQEIEGEQIAIDADGVASALEDADSVIIVPGYGMAVAQAQGSISELTKRLRAKGKDRALRHPPRRRPAARPHERAARRGEGALRHRAGDGRDQRRLPLDRRRHRHRLERHREPRRAGGPEQPDRRHAGARGLEGEAGVRVQARAGHRLFRHREPALLQGEHADVLRRRQGLDRRAADADQLNGAQLTPTPPRAPNCARARLSTKPSVWSSTMVGAGAASIQKAA
jgi:H+-translocating NAD(P) transhydrogenase subunit beta